MATLTLHPDVIAVFEQAALVLKPPPKITVSEWAERERVLSSESSSAVGQYRCSRAPYQRGMMDAVNEPGVEEIVYFTAAQVGKSLCMENIFAYFATEDPCPVLWIWPSEKVAKEWSSDTLAPMIRDTPALASVVQEGVRRRGISTLQKRFPGGWLAITGANSPANLRRRRARIILADELDGYDVSAGTEGDPVSLAAERSQTFWNKLIVKASTCTVKGESAIEAAYHDTDMRKYWVPCPHCTQQAGEVAGFQVLQWRDRMILDKEPPHAGTVYACEHCGAALAEFDKPWMLEHGEWRAEQPEIAHKIGFWLSSLYSPFITWAELTSKFLKATKHRENPELLKTFINLSLAETWEEREDRLDRNELRKRCEDYPRTLAGAPLLPDGVTVLTAGVDVQQDRLEMEVVGWGARSESWSIVWKRFEGDTEKPEVWAELDAYIDRQRFLHVRGLELEIARTLVDSGFHADQVYKFTKPRAALGIYASKGSGDWGHPPVKKATFSNRARVKLWPVGVSQIKRTTYARLAIETPGPGYCHFSNEANDADYFEQLTSEKLKKEYAHGFPRLYWYLPPGHRNEALDCRVLAYAALQTMSEDPDRMVEALRRKLLDEARVLAEQRKAKINPNQLTLTDVVDELPPVEDATAAAAVKPDETLRNAVQQVETPSTPAPVERKATPSAPVRHRIRSSWL